MNHVLQYWEEDGLNFSPYDLCFREGLKFSSTLVPPTKHYLGYACTSLYFFKFFLSEEMGEVWNKSSGKKGQNARLFW